MKTQTPGATSSWGLGLSRIERGQQMTQAELETVGEGILEGFEGLCVECGEPIFDGEGVDVGGHFTCRVCVEDLLARGLLIEEE